MRETRPQVLLHHITMALQHTALTMRAYATTVAQRYDERTPVAARSLKFHVTTDPYSDERLNAQIVKRALDEIDRLPSALEESLVLALPDPFRGECKRELAARYGDLAAPIPRGEHGAAVADASVLMRECGEVLGDLAQCMDANGVMPGKQSVARRAIGNLDDVQAACVSLKARLCNSITPSGTTTIHLAGKS